MQVGLPWWIGHGDPVTGVRVAADHGFDRIEISLEAPWPGALDPDALADAADDAGVRLGFHAPWRGQSIGHPHRGLAEAAREVVRTCLTFAEATGGDYVVLHVDPRDFGRYPDADVLEQGVDHAIRGLEALVERAGAVEVVVENTWPPVGTVDELGRILEAVPGAGFCFDPGHAVMSARAVDDDGVSDPGAWADRVGDRWSLLHLMDVVVIDDTVVDHLLPGAGAMPLDPVLDAARRAGCDRCVVEAFHADTDGTPADPDAISASVAELGL